MWRYTMRYKKLLFADFICVFGFILIELGLPTILARMIDKGIIPKDMDYIYQQGIWMVVITIIGVAMNILLGTLVPELQQTLFVIFVMIYLKRFKLSHTVNMKVLGFLP